MDLLDKKILFELDINSRLTYSQISKKLNQSQETIRYRVKKLIENKVIKFFISSINGKKLGISYYQLLIKLKNLNFENRKALFLELANEKEFCWVSELEGNFDLGLIFSIKNQLELEIFIKNFNNKYSKHIMKKELSINLSAVFLNKNYLINTPRKKNINFTYEGSEKIIQLDEIDHKICLFLSKDSRLTSIELSHNLSKSSDLVLDRIKKLKKNNVLTGHSIILNHQKANLLHYKFLLNLNLENNAEYKKLISYLKSNQNCIVIINTLGRWELEIDFEFENLSQASKITFELNDLFSNLIIDYQKLRILEVYRFNFYN